MHEFAQPRIETGREARIPRAARRAALLRSRGRTWASGFLSPFTSAISQLLGNLLPVGGWRIYTISGSMPIFYPGLLPPRDRRARTHAAQLQLRRAAGAAAGPTRSRPSTASPAGRSRTCTGRVSASRTCSPSSSRFRAPRRSASSRSRCPTSTRSRSTQVGAPRRDARPRDGRPAALAAARLAGPRRDPGDVRLQGRQVADPDRPRRPPADRLLGRPRLRPGRLGRPLEWLRV